MTFEEWQETGREVSRDEGRARGIVFRDEIQLGIKQAVCAVVYEDGSYIEKHERNKGNEYHLGICGMFWQSTDLGELERILWEERVYDRLVLG